MANVIFFVKTLILQNNATNRQNGCKIIVKNLENPYNTRILTIFKVASFLSTRLKTKRTPIRCPFVLVGDVVTVSNHIVGRGLAPAVSCLSIFTLRAGPYT